MTVIEQLKNFLNSHERNKWIGDEFISVYVRKSRRLSPQEKELISCLDIASVSVVEHEQRKGIFKKFLYEFHEINPYSATFVEAVSNEHLYNYLTKENWTKVCDSFFLMKG